MKTYKECCNEVAKAHKLGNNLITGHKAVYYEEAAAMYVKEVIDHIGVSIAMCDVVYTPEDWQIIKSKLLENKRTDTMNIKIKSYVVGWNAQADKVEVYNTESDAAIYCSHWTTVEAEDRRQAREEYVEKYKPQIEE